MAGWPQLTAGEGMVAGWSRAEVARLWWERPTSRKSGCFLLLFGGHLFFRHFSESPRDVFLETTQVAACREMWNGERDREQAQMQNSGRGEVGLLGQQ